MANKRYYWLKLHDDFFKSKRIKKLRKLGSDFVIIYLKMQLLSLQNNGILEFSGIEDDFASEIALDIDEDVDKVQLTISYLQSCGLLECTEDNEFFLPYVEKLTGSETQSTIRSRKSRENKALEQLSIQNALQCNTNATKCNREKDIELDIDIDKELNNRLSKDNLCQTQSVQQQVHLIVDAWNNLEQFGVKKISRLSADSKRYKSLVARIKQYSFDDVLMAIDNIKNSDFLCGKSTDWIITFDWFVKPNNFPKVLEGNYTNKTTIAPYENAEKHFEESFKKYPNQNNYKESKTLWLRKVVEYGNTKDVAVKMYKAMVEYVRDFESKYSNSGKTMCPKSLDKFLESDLEYWLEK